MNLPNWLTTIRIVLIPLILFFLLTDFSPDFAGLAEILAFAVFVVAAVTDALDGHLARKGKAVTVTGKILDPLADKLLVSGVLIALLDLGRITAWPVFLIISREFAVTGLRLIALIDGKTIASSILGKIKTILQTLTIVAFLIPSGIVSIPANVTNTLLWVSVLFTLYSGLDYYIRGKAGKGVNV